MKTKIILLFFIFCITFYIILKQDKMIKIPKEDRIFINTSIQTLEGKVTSVFDGDAFEIDLESRIRLYGIDAPEIEQECIIQNENEDPDKKETIVKCGIDAKTQLSNLILDKNIFCIIKGKTEDNSYLGDCFINKENKRNKKKDKINVNKEMILSGNAIAYQKHTDKYVDDENIAKSNNKGIWLTTFETPFEYRKRINLK